MNVIPHKDVNATKCPWKNFDFEKLNPEFEFKEWTWTYLGKYKITQYHPWYWSPINDSASIGGSRNITASGLPLVNEYAGNVVACPPELSIGKDWDVRAVLWVEDIWQVECVDRWGWIKWKHLDLFVWLWKVGYDNRMSWKFLYWNQNKDVYLLYEYKIK